MRGLLAVAVLVLNACASSGRAGPADRFTGEVPLQVTVRGSLYAGTATLTRAGEAASGTFVMTGPVEVKGTVSGRIAQSTIVLDLAYDIAQNGCKGTMKLSGPISAATVVEGSAEAQDSCVGRMTGTFRLGKS